MFIFNKTFRIFCLYSTKNVDCLEKITFLWYNKKYKTKINLCVRAHIQAVRRKQQFLKDFFASTSFLLYYSILYI